MPIAASHDFGDLEVDVWWRPPDPPGARRFATFAIVRGKRAPGKTAVPDQRTTDTGHAHKRRRARLATGRQLCDAVNSMSYPMQGTHVGSYAAGASGCASNGGRL